MKLSNTDIWIGVGITVISMLGTVGAYLVDGVLQYGEFLGGLSYEQMVLTVSICLCFLLPIFIKKTPPFQKGFLSFVVLFLAYFLLLILSEIVQVALGIFQRQGSNFWLYYFIEFLIIAITSYTFWQISSRQFYPTPSWLILALFLVFCLGLMAEQETKYYHLWLPIMVGISSWLAIQHQVGPPVEHRADILDDLAD